MAVRDNINSRVVAEVLHCCGIRHAVLSPGTRCFPLLKALNSTEGIACRTVIDERCAAFVGLGICDATNSPVALTCTSGTAPLNYAPALAEAYYRYLPLIAITADRPAEWIDQDDSQTIRQPGIFSNFVKGTFDIACDCDEDTCANIVEEAIALASIAPRGPVHINVQISEPDAPVPDTVEVKISHIKSSLKPLNKVTIHEFADVFKKFQRILVAIGSIPTNSDMTGMLEALKMLPNVAVVTDPVSDAIECAGSRIDPITALLSDNPEAVPEVLITIGGGQLSGRFKQWLRTLTGVTHYNIDKTSLPKDCFRLGARHICGDECLILREAAMSCIPAPQSEYKDLWHMAESTVASHLDRYCETAPWSQLVAMNILAKSLKGFDIQLSNGMTVRYADIVGIRGAHCNRGVSGIDGSISTAVGFACENNKPTIIITGDMSMQYDLAALSLRFIPENFKIIVFSNSGGGIFDYIKSTRSEPDRGLWFKAPMNLPLSGIAEAYEMKYFNASSRQQLEENLQTFLQTPHSILEIYTDSQTDAITLSKFYKTLK